MKRFARPGLGIELIIQFQVHAVDEKWRTKNPPGSAAAEKSIRPPAGEDNLIYSVCSAESNHWPCEYRLAWTRAAALVEQIFSGERDSPLPTLHTCRSPQRLHLAHFKLHKTNTERVAAERRAAPVGPIPLQPPVSFRSLPTESTLAKSVGEI